MQHHNVIIIGGGIAGVTFAQQCAQHQISAHILEASDRLGGCIQTAAPESTPGFWLETGCHTIYNSYQHLIQQFIQPAATLLIKRQNYPFQLYDGQQFLSVLKRLGWLRAGIGFAGFKLTKAGSRSVEDYFGRLFGQKNYQETLRYCFDAVLSQDSRHFPADFLFKPRKRDKSKPRSFSLQGGLSHLFDQTAVDNNMTSFNCPVITAKRDHEHWYIQTPNETLTANYLVFATPWQVTQQIITASHWHHWIPEYAPKPSPISSISLIFPRQAVEQVPLIAGAIGIQQPFYSMISRDVIPDANYRGFVFHFRGHHEHMEPLVEQACQVLGVKPNQTCYRQLDHRTLPRYQQHHPTFLATLQQQLTNHLYFTGNYFTRLAAEDCVKRSLEEFQRFKQHFDKT